MASSENVPAEETEGFAEDVTEIAAKRPFLEEALSEIYRDMIRGEQRQDELNELFVDNEFLARVCLLLLTRINQADETSPHAVVSEILSTASEEGELDEDVAQSFLEFWQSYNWIIDAAEMYRQVATGFDFWTDQGMNIDYDPGEDYTLIIEWEAQRGTDQLWDMRLPLVQTVVDQSLTTSTLHSLLNGLIDDLGPNPNISQEEIDQLKDASEELRENAKEFEELVNDLSEYTESDEEGMNDYSQFSEFIGEEEEAIDDTEYEY